MEITTEKIHEPPLQESPDVTAALRACFGTALRGCADPDNEGWNVIDYQSCTLYYSNDTLLRCRGLGDRAEAIFCFFLEPALEFSHISLNIIDITIFIHLES